MRWVFAFIIALHGLIHLMGPANAFGCADLPQLTQPISRAMGLVWLAAVAVLFSGIGAFYYLRIVKLMYFHAPEGESSIQAGQDVRVLLMPMP